MAALLASGDHQEVRPLTALWTKVRLAVCPASASQEMAHGGLVAVPGLDADGAAGQAVHAGIVPARACVGRSGGCQVPS